MAGCPDFPGTRAARHRGLDVVAARVRPHRDGIQDILHRSRPGGRRGGHDRPRIAAAARARRCRDRLPPTRLLQRVGPRLLASLPPEALATYLDDTSVSAITPYKLIRRPAVEAAIDLVRVNGFFLCGPGGRTRFPLRCRACSSVRRPRDRCLERRCMRRASTPRGDDRLSPSNLADASRRDIRLLNLA